MQIFVRTSLLSKLADNCIHTITSTPHEGIIFYRQGNARCIALLVMEMNIVFASNHGNIVAAAYLVGCFVAIK